MLFSCEVASCVPVLETFLQVTALEDSRRDLTFEVTSDILTNNRSPPSPCGDEISSCGMWMILCCHLKKLEHSGRILDVGFYFWLLRKLISDTGSNYGHTPSFSGVIQIQNKDMFQSFPVVITTQLPVLGGRRHFPSCFLGNLRS